MPHLDERIRAIVESALEHTVNGVVITDALQPGHPIIHVNAGFCRITGYAAAEVLGRNCKFLQGIDQDQPGVHAMRTAIAERRACTVLLRNYRKDGRMFWNEVQLNPVADPDTGNVRHFFALQTDVTLKKQAEDDAVLHALELERIFSSAPVGMLTFDAQDRVHLASPALLGMFKLDADQLTGERRAAVPGILRAACGQVDDALTWEWPSTQHPVRWTLPGEPQRAVEVSLSKLSDLSHECVVLIRDVSEELAQVVTRSQFLATAAHELRTPMGSIKGFTELLLMRDFSAQDARPLLETILNQSMRLSAMLNDLLDLSRVDALGSQAFAVKSMPLMPSVQRALQVVNVPGNRRTVHLQVPEGAPRVQGNPAKLEQVLINLLSNAIKYSPADAAIKLTVQASPDARAWLLKVSDQGIGLSEGDQAKLFTRFFRANPNGPIPGTGLGLVIAKELVERMGGTIEVSSKPGQGSTFTVSLQACPAAAASALASATTTPEPSPLLQTRTP